VKRVVIADDSTMARAFIIKCLHVAGYHDAEIAEAKNGQEALEFLREKPADLLITDLNMPVLDGLQLVRRVSASPKLIGVPILVITSVANPATEKELMDSGAKLVLSKPVNPAEFAQAVKGVIG
jgi:two-component system, chemotaxis family, chemotaxis protein CheY